ncbi:DUF4296 domain-containing protein [Longitalea luteola]|uniref:DUF4296 domain-containing protein n=1 Tax=Longitalea luteola TaxID=2812563 RepID=UPI001A958320|nr:DUF4296 domain-containing protein [Longitalea luteola]
MRRLSLVCLSAIAWCLVSCTNKDKIPAGVIPRDKMQKVLWDMIQAERFRETFVRDSALDLKAETFKLYAQIFDVHDVTKDEFIRSYKFYMSRPDIARNMFDSLATQANRQREELYRPKPQDTTRVQQPPAPAADSTSVADSPKAVQAQPAGPLPAGPLTREKTRRLHLKNRKGGDSLFHLKPKS